MTNLPALAMGNLMIQFQEPQPVLPHFDSMNFTKGALIAVLIALFLLAMVSLLWG